MSLLTVKKKKVEKTHNFKAAVFNTFLSQTQSQVF